MGILNEQLAVHLEFYGYKIEKRETAEGKPPFYIATHDERPNMRFWEIAPYFVMFGAGFRSQNGPSPEICELMNRLNENMVVTRAYSEPLDPGPGVIVKFESVYMGAYKRDLFAAFYDLMTKDGAMMYKLADCDKLFRAAAA